MNRTCHLKCDVCGRDTHKHETLEALQTDTQGWYCYADMHVCNECQRPTRADIAPSVQEPFRPRIPGAAELDWN